MTLEKLLRRPKETKRRIKSRMKPKGKRENTAFPVIVEEHLDSVWNYIKPRVKLAFDKNQFESVFQSFRDEIQAIMTISCLLSILKHPILEKEICFPQSIKETT